MSKGHRLVKTMRRIAEQPDEELTDIVTGTVISVDPLKIKVSDDIILTNAFLILGAMVRRMVVNIPAVTASYRGDSKHRHLIPQHTTSVAQSHSHIIPDHYTEFALPEICLWRGLEQGDEVRMLRCYSGQKYYVIERLEGVL